jgi:hypothetical protein
MMRLAGTLAESRRVPARALVRSGSGATLAVGTPATELDGKIVTACQLHQHADAHDGQAGMMGLVACLT